MSATAGHVITINYVSLQFAWLLCPLSKGLETGWNMCAANFATRSSNISLTESHNKYAKEPVTSENAMVFFVKGVVSDVLQCTMMKLLQ